MKQMALFPDALPPKKQTIPDAWELFVDGASRKNPGPAGVGIFIRKNGEDVLKKGFFVGTKTNNQAEYMALICGVMLLKKEMQVDDTVSIFSDSELLVRQIKGTYRVKKPELQCLHRYVSALLSDIDYLLIHVLRDKNKIADALANEGIDKKVPLPRACNEIFTTILHLDS